LKRLALLLTSRLLAVSVGFSVAAQQASPDLAQCLNKGKALSLDLQISGCTAILQDGGETPANRAGAYISRGIAHYNKGENEPAIADFSEAIKLDPSDAKAYANRGTAYERKRDYDRAIEAIEDYTTAIRINPSDAGAYNGRAEAYFTIGEAAQGLIDAERSLQLRPNDAATLYTRGIIYEALGRREDAIADFRRSQAINPHYPASREALQRLGVAP
jgi:tetratricopeptide (TPR) repeat protein